MKKWIMRGISLFLITFFAFFSPMSIEEVEAAKLKGLMDFKNYKIDLDGDGRKETINWHATNKNEAGYKVVVTVDGKDVIKTKRCTDFGIYIGDYKKNDGKKEIFIQGTSDSEVVVFFAAYRYNSSKKKATVFYKHGYNEKIGTRYVFSNNAVPGNGTVILDVEGHNEYLGNYNYTRSFVVKNKKLEGKGSVFEVVSANRSYTVDSVLLDVFETRELADKAENGEDVTHVCQIGENGDEFTLDKIYGTNAEYLYVTYEGNSGWLLNPEYDYLSDYDEHIWG